MRLTDLEPQFIKWSEPHSLRHVDTLHEADGILFLCPKCFQQNNGPVGTHSVICWFEGHVSDDVEPKPGRWNPTGNGYEDLSFVPGKKSHSVLLLGGCAWHGYLQNGEITNV